MLVGRQARELVSAAAGAWAPMSGLDEERVKRLMSDIDIVVFGLVGLYGDRPEAAEALRRLAVEYDDKKEQVMDEHEQNDATQDTVYPETVLGVPITWEPCDRGPGIAIGRGLQGSRDMRVFHRRMQGDGRWEIDAWDGPVRAYSYGPDFDEVERCVAADLERGLSKIEPTIDTGDACITLPLLAEVEEYRRDQEMRARRALANFPMEHSVRISTRDCLERLIRLGLNAERQRLEAEDGVG